MISVNIRNKQFSKLIMVFLVFNVFFITHKSWATPRKIHITVNEDAITNGNLSRRINFLKLRKVYGDLNKIAEQELITETLKRQEIQRSSLALNNKAFINFIFENKSHEIGLSVDEFINMLETQGIGEKHYKESLAIQIFWNDFINKIFILKNGNFKIEPPHNRNKTDNVTIKEYILRTVTFVTPDKSRNDHDFMGKRIKEAEASRAKFTKCSKAEEFASKMIDVSIGKEQRFLETDLSLQMQNLIKKARNNTTDVYPTQLGIEYIAICDKLSIGGEIALNERFKYKEMPKKLKQYEQEYIKNMLKNANIRFYK